MDFELSDELQALQETCRRIAQNKVKPRAREIDESGEYPQDLFEVFRDAGLLGLCIPEDLGGSGAGILGLTIAIEEVAATPWPVRSPTVSSASPAGSARASYQSPPMRPVEVAGK